MITITTQFKVSEKSRKAIAALEFPPDRPSDLLPIDPNKCYQIGTTGEFRWIDVFAGHSPEDPGAYVKDVLSRRRRFLEINHRSGKFFELVSCQIEIDNLSFACKLSGGKWVS